MIIIVTNKRLSVSNNIRLESLERIIATRPWIIRAAGFLPAIVYVSTTITLTNQELEVHNNVANEPSLTPCIYIRDFGAQERASRTLTAPECGGRASQLPEVCYQ